jgi:hypothetical protein
LSGSLRRLSGKHRLEELAGEKAEGDDVEADVL